ncbi:MAG: hypothetical protein H0W07_04560 [Chloroflexi bacterium]|nr:hypothetical protein [Chloroflexota bacterium]
MGESTKQARQAVVAARAALATEADELTAATRSALDIPAKVRKHPVETAGLAGGAVFLAVGGPRRLLKAAGKAVRRGKEPPPKTLLPKDVQKVVDGLGDDGRKVQERLEREFAAYLEKRKKADTPTSSRASFWRLFDVMAIPLGRQVAKQMAERLLAADRDRPASVGEPMTGTTSVSEAAAGTRAAAGTGAAALARSSSADR